MPLGAIAEFLLQPLAEALLQIAGYFTSRIVVPVLSFGRAHVEPAPKGALVKPRWHGFQRGSDGKIVVDAEMGSLLGLLFWILVGIIAFVIYHRNAT